MVVSPPVTGGAELVVADSVLLVLEGEGTVVSPASVVGVVLVVVAWVVEVVAWVVEVVAAVVTVVGSVVVVDDSVVVVDSVVGTVVSADTVVVVSGVKWEMLRFMLPGVPVPVQSQ